MRKRLGSVILVLAVLAGCASDERRPQTLPAHHRADGFRNLYIDDPGKSFFSFLKMRYFSDVAWADHRRTADQVPVAELNPQTLHSPGARPAITWLGHSTFFIQYRGMNILTDPVFSDRASPLGFAGPKRYVPHALDYRELPPVDYVVISHNHYDHLDDKATRLLGNEPVYLVPLGLADYYREQGVAADRIREFDWWDSAQMPGLTVTATPSQHWSARSLFDRFDTLWAAWRLEIDGFSIWFAGDTGYNPVQFKQTGDRLGPVDWALIPIGAYAPRSFMGPYHVNPEEAVRIHRDVQARRSLGMHWGTFPLTAEPPMEPPRRLAEARRAAGVPASRFGTLAIGERAVYPD